MSTTPSNTLQGTSAAFASTPTVSILIPAYKPDYFQECLESCLQQRDHIQEIIISDDCPTDAIQDIVTPYLDTADGALITYVRNTPSLGLAANYLQLAGMGKGDWFKFVDDDDTLTSDCIAQMAARATERVSLVMGQCDIEREDGNNYVKKEDLPEFTDGKEYFLHRYKKTPVTLFTRFMVRRDVVRDLLGENVPARMISLDELVGLRACLYGDIAYLNETICMHRDFEGGYSRNTELEVLVADLEYLMNPFRKAEQDSRFSTAELKRWKKRTLKTYARGIISKLIQQKRYDDLNGFVGMLIQQFGSLGYVCALSPRLIIKYVKSFFRR